MMDLHLHTLHSDGALNVPAVFSLCRSQGLRIVAITDHDTLTHLENIREIAEPFGLTCHIGCEFSLQYGEFEVHTLGYDFEASDELKQIMSDRHVRRTERYLRIIDSLRAEGFVYNPAFPSAFRDGQFAFSRQVLAQSENEERLQKEGISTIQDFVARYLELERGIYLPQNLMDIEEGIALIKKYGGMAVIAHPFRTFAKDRQHILTHLDVCAGFGAEGIEVGYSSHSIEDALELHEFAGRRNLFETGGSDFHRTNDGEPSLPGAWKDYGITLRLPDFIRQ